jgi:hypothetical protein
LKGGYYEWTPVFDQQGNKLSEVRKWHGPGSFRLRGADSYHRIELDPSIECWTMFMPGPQQKEWGFLVNDEWIESETYLSKMALHKTKVS